MKNIYFIIIIVFCGIQLQAKKPKVKRDSVLTESNSYLPLSDKTLTNLQKPANWFTDAWDSFLELFKPAWGSYSEGGTTNISYPLACADRKTEITNLKGIITNKIKTGQYFDLATWNIYKEVFDNAEASLGSHKDYEVCKNASIAKDAAFVYWLGIDADGDSLTPSARNAYFVKIKNIMWSWADSKAGSKCYVTRINR